MDRDGDTDGWIVTGRQTHRDRDTDEQRQDKDTDGQ